MLTPITTSRHSRTIISLKFKTFRITEYISINGKKINILHHLFCVKKPLT